jgi:SAM-dependent methyltransferase
LEYSFCISCGHEKKVFLLAPLDDYNNNQSIYFGSDSSLIVSTPNYFDKITLYHRINVLSAFISNNSKILEVGPGSGFLSGYLIKEGHDVVLFEKSGSLAFELRKKFQKNVIEIGLEEYSGNDIEADIFIAFHVIEHVLDPKIFLSSALHLVKVGGYAFIATPNSRSLIHNLFKRLSPNYDEAHFNIFSEKSLVRFCEEAGWHIVRVETPEFSVDWLRVFSKFIRRIRGEDESLTAGKYADKKSFLPVVKIFQILSFLPRLLVRKLKLGNELFVVLRRES